MAASVKLPVRWWSGRGYHQGKLQEDGYRYGELELERERTAFMVVDSDCGPGNPWVEEGIAPALAAARRIGLHVVFIHNDFSLVNEPGSIKRELHHTRWGEAAAALLFRHG